MPYLQKIRLRNVRQFEDETFEFKDGFNLLVGENGKGKSTLLAAIATAYQIDSPNRIRKTWRFEEIRLGTRRMEIDFFFNDEGSSAPVVASYAKSSGGLAERSGSDLRVQVLAYSSGASLVPSLRYKRSRLSAAEENLYGLVRDQSLSEEERRLKRLSARGSDANPVRSREIRDFVEKALISFNPLFSGFTWRFVPYGVSVRSPELDEKQAESESAKGAKIRFERLILRALAENPEVATNIDSERIILQVENGSVMGSRQKKLSSLRGVVRKAIKKEFHEAVLFGNYEIEIRLSPRISVHTKDGELLLSQLSDGEQRIFSIITDIAQCLLQSSDKAISDSSAIVLIDEIDVHLHPRWQRKVVGILKKLFPNCQFIATTHSPFVVQGVPESHVQHLDHEILGDFTDRGIEEIAVKVMGIKNHQVSERYLDMLDTAKEYFELLELAKSERKPAELLKLRKKLRSLSSPYAENPAYQAYLEMHGNLKLGREELR
jgi:predicted ATP-binding protein involved in virulence